MFNQKHNTFHFFVQTGKYYSLNIARGKVVIAIEISKRDAFNEPLLNQFVNNFLNDLDFRKRLTLAADPLNTSGFVDIDIGRSFLHFGSLSEEISSLVDKEKEGKAVEEDYLNLRIRSDKFSKMNEKALSLFMPKKTFNKVMEKLPYPRLQRRALRWLARGLPFSTTMRKMKIDRRYKNY